MITVKIFDTTWTVNKKNFEEMYGMKATKSNILNVADEIGFDDMYTDDCDIWKIKG